MKMVQFFVIWLLFNDYFKLTYNRTLGLCTEMETNMAMKALSYHLKALLRLQLWSDNFIVFSLNFFWRPTSEINLSLLLYTKDTWVSPIELWYHHNNPSIIY